MIYSANTLILDHGGAGEFDDVGPLRALEPIEVGDIYYLFYGGVKLATGYYQIGLATSRDGIGFTKDPNNPVVPLGGGGDIDEHGAYPIGVIYVRDKFYIFYIALNSGDVGVIAWASGKNPNSLTKHGKIIDPPAGGTFTTVVAGPGVEYRERETINPPGSELAISEIFILRYVVGFAGPTYEIRMATLKLW